MAYHISPSIVERIGEIIHAVAFPAVFMSPRYLEYFSQGWEGGGYWFVAHSVRLGLGISMYWNDKNVDNVCIFGLDI